MGKGIFSQYWGKTVREDSKEASCHLLIWHSLDVAAVASSWWDCSPSIRSFFCRKSPSLDEAKVKAWILFFIALHDIGKFDTAPYAHHPKLIRSLAVARASLHKHLNELKPQGELAYVDGD